MSNQVNNTNYTYHSQAKLGQTYSLINFPEIEGIAVEISFRENVPAVVRLEWSVNGALHGRNFFESELCGPIPRGDV